MTESNQQRTAHAVMQLQRALRGGRIVEGMRMADAALAKGLSDPLFHRLRGVLRQQEDRPAEAVADFEIALAAAPGDFTILSALGLCLARAGRAPEGLARLDAALAANDAYAPAHYNRAWTLEVIGDLARAKAGYQRALELDSAMAIALGNLAALAARSGSWGEAVETARAALALDPGQPAATIALAGAEAAEGDADAAGAMLTALLDNPRASAHERAVALGTLGDVLDGQGLFAQAFDAYQARAAAFRAIHAPRFEQVGADTTLTLVRRLDAYFASADPAQWRRADEPEPRNGAVGHVFLVGFPRSGTTMLGQALAGHQQIVTLDEQETLADAAAAFFTSPQALDRLAAIDADEAARFRGLYWERVRKGGADWDAKVLVDKLPMNALAMPLIVKLFPTAKVLFLERDPRDVVLSAFRRQFAPNPTTYAFTSLTDTAELYDAVLSLMGRFEQVLDLDLRRQSYERLVADFDTEVGAICRFIGLDWTPSMADFAGRAAAVATPSSAQLSRGLNSEGIGHWRNYADALAPVLPILRPWLEALGYEAN
jgi:tetratricopeptide (TPR) repeat protein